MKDLPTWRYHQDHQPRIFHTAEDVAAAEADGWVDTPEKLDASLSEKNPITIPDEIAAMDKEALVAFAWENLGLNLDKRRALDTLKEQVALAMAKDA